MLDPGRDYNKSIMVGDMEALPSHILTDDNSGRFNYHWRVGRFHIYSWFNHATGITNFSASWTIVGMFSTFHIRSQSTPEGAVSILLSEMQAVYQKLNRDLSY